MITYNDMEGGEAPEVKPEEGGAEESAAPAEETTEGGESTTA